MTRYAIDAKTIAKNTPDAYAPLGGPISPLEDGYEDLSGLYPYNLEQGNGCARIFGVNYIAPIDILVPKEYESIGNDVKPPSKPQYQHQSGSARFRRGRDGNA